MSDRVHSLIVVLEHDMRTDDVESLMDAIRHFRGVLSVQGKVADIKSCMAESRAKHEYRRKLVALLEESQP